MFPLTGNDPRTCAWISEALEFEFDGRDVMAIETISG
jgi:hypothetical protein